MNYFLILVIIGLSALGMAWMPALANRTRISYSILYVGLGMLLYSLIGRLPAPNPFRYPEAAVHFTELVVIVALMGTGLKIDQPFSLKTWALPLRMVSISMILCIAGGAFIAVRFFGFDLASAILLAAVLAPTDPVLASDVQVAPPLEGEKETVRFSLTAEGGMNDGTAFPFVWLAIYLALQGAGETASIAEWFGYQLIYKLVAGLACGFGLGKILGYVLFRLPEKIKIVKVNDGFAALAMTLLVYGITELVHGYGFIAVFVSAVTLRNEEMEHRLHRKLHAFSDQIERILVAITLLLFGGALAYGILRPITWELVVFSLLFLFVIRPLTTWVSFFKMPVLIKEKWAISFFGIRGIGSFYYIAFALTQANFKEPGKLWAVVAFIVLMSILLHGLTAATVIRNIEKEKEEEVQQP
jgi:NhaP-type Na+/H+ or K+/H+ antiporter